MTFVDRIPKASLLRASPCRPTAAPPPGRRPRPPTTSCRTPQALAENLWAVHTNQYDYVRLDGEADTPASEEERQYRDEFVSDYYETEHPVVRVHPETGRRVLLLGHFVKRFVGLVPTESATLFNLLQARVTKLENTVRWSWEPGDVAIWDNRTTQHYAVADYDDQHRRLSRITAGRRHPGGCARPAQPGRARRRIPVFGGGGTGGAGRLIGTGRSLTATYRERVSRSRDQDACPSALQVHQAADGALVRVRLPGGMITAAQLQALADLATGFGCRLAGTDLARQCPTAGHPDTRRRSPTPWPPRACCRRPPMNGPATSWRRRCRGAPAASRDVRPWVADLDAAIQAEPALAALPGRFWFALDDGRGDVSGLRADVGVQVLDAHTVALLLTGVDTGVRLSPDTAVPTLVTIAVRFQRIRENRWRIAELDDTAALMSGFVATAPPGHRARADGAPPVGWITQDDGRVTLGAAVPLGVLPARTAEFLAAIDAPLVVTPWRSVLVCDLTRRWPTPRYGCWPRWD